MSIRIEGEAVFLEGDCGVEDAEPLAAALDGADAVRVDLSSCRNMHSAVVQALLLFRPAFGGAPDNPFLNRFVLPALIGHDASGGGLPAPTRDHRGH